MQEVNSSSSGSLPGALPEPKLLNQVAARWIPGPLLSEFGTYETVKARFWPWLSGESPWNLFKRFSRNDLKVVPSWLGSGSGGP